ncbi:MAG: prephenate dehydrogenase/arogenate dehydrogenase family protein, partial [Fimbriimonadales bacterium]
HPIAGTEHHGWQSAQADLFQGAQWVLTPTSITDANALAHVEELVRKVGATPLTMDAEHHDREMALLSHLPHAIAFSLNALHTKHPTTLQGGSSWRSATRVAQSDPTLWSEIFHLNREALLQSLSQFQKELAEIESLLQTGDAEAIDQWLAQARRQIP